MATSDMENQRTAESSVVKDVQSRLSGLNVGEDVEEEMATYMKITIMRDCKQDMLAIGPTPKLDKAIKVLEDAVVMDTGMGIDKAPLDKGSEATETLSAGELTPQTLAEPSEASNEYINTPTANTKPTPVYSNESSVPLILPSSTYNIRVSEASARHWSQSHNTHANKDKKLFLYYCKYIDDSRTILQFQLQLLDRMDYEETVFDLDKLYSINFCVVHSCLKVTWTTSATDDSDCLTVYFSTKSSSKVFYDFLVEDLKDSGCRFSTNCKHW